MQIVSPSTNAGSCQRAREDAIESSRDVVGYDGPNARGAGRRVRQDNPQRNRDPILRGAARRTARSPLHEGLEVFGREQCDPASVFGKPVFMLPSREQSARRERADIREGTELFVSNVDRDSRRLHDTRFAAQLQQLLGEPRFCAVGHDVDVTLHVPPQILERQPKTILAKFRVCLYQAADGVPIPD